MRVLALALLALGLATPGSIAAPHRSCPGTTALGSVSFQRGGWWREVSLSTCAERTTRPADPITWATASADGRFIASVRSSGSGRTAKQTIWVTDLRRHRSHPVVSETQYYRQIGPGDTPGPIELLRLSNDGRWIVYTVDPGGSGSIAADGLTVRVVSTDGGAVRKLGKALAYPDYFTWCAGSLVYVGGIDRVAIHAKRLLVARPPDWRPRPLWSDDARSFGSVTCAPDSHSVAVLSQRSSVDASFFATRWRLWRVRLDGTRDLLDTPPPGSADESPYWAPDGRSILFVRERNGYGRLMLRHEGTVYGPFANLGYSLGYYGHHAWFLLWSA